MLTVPISGHRFIGFLPLRNKDDAHRLYFPPVIPQEQADKNQADVHRINLSTDFPPKRAPINQSDGQRLDFLLENPFQFRPLNVEDHRKSFELSRAPLHCPLPVP